MPDILPHNIEAEQIVLGSILAHNPNYGAVAAEIEPRHFFEPLHAQIMFQIGQLISSGQSATPITLKDVFPSVEVVHGVSIGGYLGRLMTTSACSNAELQSVVSRVRELSQMRGIVEVATRIKTAGMEGVFPENALTEAWSTLDEIRNDIKRDSGNRGAIGEFARMLLDADSSHVVSTGLSDLDQSIAGGWRSGRLYILAGRPGMGKTILGTSTARRVARKGNGVSFYSLELDTKEVTARMVADAMSSMAQPIPYRDIVAGILDDHGKQQTQRAIEHLEKLPILLDSTGGLAINDIEARARIDRERFAKSGHRLAVVVIDYLGLIRAADRYRGQRVHELGEIALAGKTMAKRLDCAVVMLSQLNRGVEARDDKRPTMSDLRDSGNIEEHADFVGLLYRPFYYTERSQKWRDQDPEFVERALAEQDTLELIVGKNRLGSTGIINLWCNPSLSAIRDKARY